MNSTLRRTVLQFHRWTGLTVGLLVIFLAITGLALVYRPQLEPMVEREVMSVAPCNVQLPLDTLLARARAARPNVPLDQVEIHGEAGATTLFRFTDKEGVYVNPCTGSVLGERYRWGGVFGTMEQWHRFRFFSADAGNFIAGSAAFAVVFLLAIGGLIVWWPPTMRALKSSVKLLPHLKGRAFELNLHRTVGLYVSLILLAIAFSSLPLAFKWVRYGMYSMVGSPMPVEKPQSAQPPAGAQPLSLGALWSRAQDVVPGSSEAVLSVSAKPLDAAEVYLIEHDAPHPNARTYVYLDKYTGNVLRHEPYAKTSLGNRIYRWLASLHMGYIGGEFGQLAFFLGALGVPVLGYTGIRSYLRKRFPAAAPPPGIKVKVKRIQSETPEIKSFELVAANGKPLANFTAGAHVDVRIDAGTMRQYSLCSSPADRDRYLIAVKRESASRGGSRAMHERIAEGDVLTISTPRNHFPIEPRATHHLLIAGGIGITPLLAMARQLQDAGESFALQYFTRSVEHTAFHALLSRPEFRGKVTFHYALEPEGLRTYLHKLLWHREEGTHMYVCGPRPFMDLVETTAASTWPPEAVHTEYFGANPLAYAGPQESFEVSLALSGGNYTIPAGKSIAHVLAEQGINVPTSCEQGVCGTCVTGVLEGEPDHRDAFLSDHERKACDKMMVCVSRAKSKRIVLDL